MYDTTKPYKQQILVEIKKTWRGSLLEVKSNIYPIFYKKFQKQAEVDHTDGIGTKGIYHWQKRTFANAVQDALAMNLNDLALVLATPYKLQNHIILPIDDHKAILSIIKALSKQCQSRKIALTGGETSIHNNSIGMDISMTVSGLITQNYQNKFEVGDMVIGLASAGLHANGFTKVRQIFGSHTRVDFTKPTLIYHQAILAISKKFPIHGMMHITGGAFTKIKDLIKKQNILINKSHKLIPQPIFYQLYHKNIADEEMYQTFNCGIGFILSVGRFDSAKVLAMLKRQGFTADIIGQIKSGSGQVIIESMFSDKIVTY
ncbi:hypothetical protein HY388_01080 [Candidatus Daviesbacteria bacterium]|nr:hypothetical protein [Candidatus Daviesbacteria bacterium]